VQSQNESGLSSPSAHSQSQGVALKSMIAKSPITTGGMNGNFLHQLGDEDQYMKPTPHVQMSNRIKS
jgi:hypothetical protein